MTNPDPLQFSLPQKYLKAFIRDTIQKWVDARARTAAGQYVDDAVMRLERKYDSKISALTTAINRLEAAQGGQQ